MAIAIDWTKGMDAEKKEKFELLLRNSTITLSRLRKILRDRRNSLEASERTPKIYDTPSWAYMQAHNNGFRQGLKYVEDLLSFMDNERKTEK